MADVFIPVGRFMCLKSAIDRLAQARRTEIQSAQAEIRTELYMGSVTAYAVQQSTGTMIKLVSSAWGTQSALPWLESGVCRLPDDGYEVMFTLDQFDVVGGPENAPIVISDNDFQRLLNSKASAAPRQSTPAISRAEEKRRFDKWRKSCGNNIPSRAEDYSHMKQFGVSRDRVRELRRGAINLPRGNARSAKPK
jgi:hypothetical protein